MTILLIPVSTQAQSTLWLYMLTKLFFLFLILSVPHGQIYQFAVTCRLSYESMWAGQILSYNYCSTVKRFIFALSNYVLH